MHTPVIGHNGYYAPTAYDSNCPRRLPPADNSKFKPMMRLFRRSILPNFGSAQCSEFFSDYDQLEIIGALSSRDKEIVEELSAPGHEELYWQTLQNPRAVIDVITKLVLIFLLCAWAWFLLNCGFALLKRPDWFLTKDFLIFFIQITIPTIVYILGKMMIHKDWVKDRNNVLFHRRRGLVSIPRRKKDPLELPFDEFDGYLGSTVNPSGSTDYHLILAHRYSASFVQNPASSREEWMINVRWEFLQQYMDISKPLPDIPVMEPYRHMDPVTAELDTLQNRPSDFWKDMDLEKAKKLNNAAYEAASHYPWGLTRKQALAAGWRPSGCGEGDWRSDTAESMPSGNMRSTFDDHGRIL